MQKKEQRKPWVWMGWAYDLSKGYDTNVVLLAFDEEDALKVYLDCIKRHPDLKAIEEPRLGLLADEIAFINSFSKPYREEFDKYDSVAFV